MADKIVSILDVQVNAKDAIEQISKYKDEIDELKTKLKEEEEQTGKNSEQSEILRQEIKRRTDQTRELQKQVQNQVRIQTENDGSLKEMRANLSNLTAQYDSLSKAERQNTEVGGAMMVSINRLTDEIKSNEEATQRYYRNVGNYTESIRRAMGSNNKYVMGLSAMGDVFKNGLANGIKTTTTAMSGFGKQLLALMANPIIAVISAIVVAIMALKKGIDSNEESSKAFEKALAPLKGLFDILILVIQKYASFMLKIIQAHIDLAMSISRLMEKLPIVGNMFKEVNDAIDNQTKAVILNQKAVEAERKQIVASAEAENKVAKLRDKVAQAQNYTTKERRKFLQEAMEIERKQALENQRIAKLKLEALKAETKTTGNTAEVMNQLAEAQAKVTRANTEYYNSVRRQQTQLATFDKEIAKEEEDKAKAKAEKAKAEAEKAKQNREEQKKNELKAIRDAQDAVMKLLADTAETRRRQLQLQYQREIEDLKTYLATTKNLTATARDNINKTILAKQEQLRLELQKLNLEELKDKATMQTQAIQSELSIVEKGSKEELNLNKKLNAEELQQKIIALTDQKNAEKITENEFAIQADNAREASRLKNAQLDEAYNQAQYERKKQALANQIALLNTSADQSYEKQMESLEKQRDIANQQLQLLLERGRTSNQTQEQFDAERISAEQNLATKEKAIGDAKLKQKKAVSDAERQVMTNTIAMLEEVGDSNEAFAKLSKVLALAQIAIDMGKAIAEMTAAESSKGIAGLATTAIGVAKIMAMMTSAISAVKSAKFASGGYVQGAGTSTSDSIPARLSNGEFVINARSTKLFYPLLEAMNNIGSGVPMQVTSSYSNVSQADTMATQMREAMTEIRPVVSVVDINREQQRVSVIQSLDNI